MQPLASPLKEVQINEESLLEIKSQPYAFGPISKLPPETLLRIFELLVEKCSGDTERWYHITHVCRLWRQLAIDTSTLWTRIPTSSDEHNPNWTRVVLQRSKSSPLSVDLVFTDWKVNLAVLQHISHIRRLYIELQAEGLNGVAYILSVVGDYATMLEHLFIWAGESEDEDAQFKLSPTCFPGTSKLDYLDLTNIDVDWSTPLLRQNLTYLSFQNLSLASAPSWDELLTALGNMPGLSELTLMQALPLTKARTNMAIVNLPRLQRLSITCNTAFQARSFLSRVTFLPLEMLKIGCDANDHDKQSYADTLRAITRRVPSKLFLDGADRRFLTITLDWSNVIHNRGHLFSFRSNGHDVILLSRATLAVDITFAPSPDVSTETIIADVLSGLQLSTNLVSVKIGGREALSPQTLQETFGSVPTLKSLYVSGKTANSLISALDVPVSPSTLLPILKFIFFSKLDMRYDGQAYKKLVYQVLLRRQSHGISIKHLHFSECPGFDKITVKCLAPFVKVMWD